MLKFQFDWYMLENMLTAAVIFFWPLAQQKKLNFKVNKIKEVGKPIILPSSAVLASIR